MLRLILKRFFIFIPTVFFTLSFCFWLGQGAMEGHYVDGLDKKINEHSSEAFIIQKFKETYHLNLPLYYFSLYRQNQPNLSLIKTRPEWEDLIINLQYKTADNKRVTEFVHFISDHHLSSELLDQLKGLKVINAIDLKSADQNTIRQLEWYNNAILSDKIQLSNHLPKIVWNGMNCQFHKWLNQLLKGHLGLSIHTQQKVNLKLFSSLKNTLSISIITVVLIFSLGIGLAYFSLRFQNSKISTFLNQFMYFIYSIPNFWLASFLILFFTTPQFLDWFPSYGFGQNDYESTSHFFEKLPYLVLPIICLAYSGIAIVYTQSSIAFNSELNKQYVLTAKSKGLGIKSIINHHIFKNAAFPIISLVSGTFLFIVSGSFVIEHIFAIPGIGKLTVDSILLRDYPMLYALIFLFSIGAFLGYLLSDLLYYLFDPRLKV